MERLKRQRGNRKGRIGQIQKQLEAYTKKDVTQYCMDEIDELLQNINKVYEAYESIQEQINDLIIDDGDDEAQQAENDEAFANEELFANARRTAKRIKENLSLHLACRQVEDSFRDWESTANPKSKYYLADTNRLLTALRGVEERLAACPILHETVQTQHGEIRKMSRKISETTHGAASVEDIRAKPATEDSHSKIHVEPPTFNGDPMKWKSFQRLFEETVKTRAKHLDNTALECLLQKALKDDKAHTIAVQNARGPDGYAKAMRALDEEFGSPIKLLPHLMKEILNGPMYAYNYEGLVAINQDFSLTYDSLRELKVDLSTFLTAMAATRFQPKLKEEWIKHIADMEALPNIDTLRDYTRKISRRLGDEPISQRTYTSVSATGGKNSRNKTSPSSSSTSTASQCIFCNGKIHSLHKCSKFMEMTPEKRGRVIKDQGWCKNCLFHSHTSTDCNSKHSCRHCGKRHHSLLHRGTLDKLTTSETATVNISTCDGTAPASTNLEEHPDNTPAVATMTVTQAISCLPTALINVRHGPRCYTARLAFDSGASVNFITEDLATKLRLKRTPQRLAYEGANSGGVSKSFVKTVLESRHDPSQKLPIELSVVSKLPKTQPPSQREAILSDSAVNDIYLADEELGGSLDILMGSFDEFHCRTGNKKYLPHLKVGLSETIFGWSVVSQNPSTKGNPILSVQPASDQLNKSLQRLWELEKTPTTQDIFSTEDNSALEQFNDTHHILPTGRYEVRLPRPPHPPILGDSRHIALKRFQGNERTMAKRDALPAFNTCLEEYIHLEHAEISPRNTTGHVNYLPVHGVFKEASTTTKLRPVFDASAKTSTGVAFNDTLLTGPTLHPNLVDLLIRFRTHRLGMSADISKMFREISLHPDERDLHRFLLRSPDNSIQDCRMKRLTFGVRPSPFLATRVLRHLAETHSHSHPDAAFAILNSFYVDDFLGGAETIEQALHIRKELCDLLEIACMRLRKWRSSDQSFLRAIPQELVETEPLTLKDSSDSPKALGVHWDVQADVLHVATPVMSPTNHGKVTKRVVASLAAQVYDVLGLFAPFTVVAKIILQAIWKSGTSWDQEVDTEIRSRWDKWKSELGLIHYHPVPRKYTSNQSPVIHKSIHGFSDASEVAYGAAIYIRQVHRDGTTSTSLIFGKARVAPVKPLTIPRAELVGAHLLAKLIIYICSILNIPLSNVTAWTDSTIVLCWLRKAPSSLKSFASHRVLYIQENLPNTTWRHVPTQDNPADLLSRGTTASTLLSSSLWWQGPDWLAKQPSQWPQNTYNSPNNLPEMRTAVLSVSTTPDTTTLDIWTKYSSYHKLCRVLAWVRRFVRNARRAGERKQDTLKQSEIQDAETFLFRKIQREYYPDILECKREGREIPRGHPFHKYGIQEKNGLLVLTGRVRTSNSTLPRELIPLSIKSPITKLFVRTLHQVHNHPGTATLMAILAETHHIPALKRYLKMVSRKCVVCQKAYAQPLQPAMGMLPAVRTTPSTPFESTGVDFAGPFTLKKGHTRKPVLIKSYVCLFVCMTTKAVHLELVSDLSTPAFMAALTRFTSRRGTPAAFYSDNGTNFVGAASDIRKIQDILDTSEEEFTIRLPRTTWHHIPPRAPHFGGLWEAGVRKMKILLRKHLAPYPLTTEELSTILTAIEATLNSRPLTACESTDPDSFVLTPGHFLIGKPLRALPREPASTDKRSTLKRWRLVQRLTEDLWTAWKGDYLRTLQGRNKWQRECKNLRVDDIVLVKDEMLQSSTEWPMARVVKVYPGDDRQVRTADIFCRGHTYKRATNRLVYLLSPEEDLSTLPSSPREYVQGSP